MSNWRRTCASGWLCLPTRHSPSFCHLGVEGNPDSRLIPPSSRGCAAHATLQPRCSAHTSRRASIIAAPCTPREGAALQASQYLRSGHPLNDFSAAMNHELLDVHFRPEAQVRELRHGAEGAIIECIADVLVTEADVEAPSTDGPMECRGLRDNGQWNGAVGERRGRRGEHTREGRNTGVRGRGGE
eukprot:scaffold77468_cov33-Tisochrysis_lutea.AAC.2